ncbi:MAG: acetyl-CoA carboxylase biotin carboxyl carrier protein, partial [Clostridia bacterium]|nr:acetyl-CoA carboxylase biotin carboxyl carrier protein [Clostridia bacterium]
EPVAEAPVVDFNQVTPVKSPMVGVFYAAPSPEKPPFVKVGDRVKKGDVLCIIEAMKLMNEITAEQDGEIADVCVANGDVVEFGQILFKIF